MEEIPGSNDMILGEMRGQLRELVHSTNNQAMKIDALTREVIALGPLSADIAEIKQRITKLETGAGQWTGAQKFAAWIVQTIISVILAIGAVVAIGRHS